MQTRSIDIEETYEKIPLWARHKFRNFINTEIPNTKFFQPDGTPNKEWHVFYGRTLADARREAQMALISLDSGKNEQYFKMIRKPESTERTSLEFAIYDMAELAFQNTRKLVKKAVEPNPIRRLVLFQSFITGQASQDAGNSAELVTHALAIEQGIDYENNDKCRTYAQARWEVFKKGYGLVRHSGDALYVYSAEPHRTSISLRK